MMDIEAHQANEIAQLRTFVAGVNTLAALPPEAWNMARLWVDALQTDPGSVLAIDGDGNMTVTKSTGDVVPVVNLVDFAALMMGEVATQTRN